MKKRWTALLLICCILASVTMSMAEESGINWTEEDRAKLRVGNPTAMEGKFFTTMWGGTTSDLDMQDLLHGYSPVCYDIELTKYRFDRSVVQDAVATDDAEGNRTYLLVFYDDLKWSDGTPITAADYAFSILFSMDPVIAETGGKPADYSWIAGAEEYLNDRSKGLKGLRILADDILQITVKAEALPYFYELSRLMIYPYPKQVIAPGFSVTDEGEGAHLSGELGKNMITETVMNPRSGYLSHPSVVSGPYMLTAYEWPTAQLTINPYFKGTEKGIVPRIGELEFTLADNTKMIGELVRGHFGLLNKVTLSESIRTGLQNQENANYAFTADSYARSGLTMIWFKESSACVQEKSVRRAVAYCFDRQGFVREYVGAYGLQMDAFSGLGQWMFRLASGLMALPVDESLPEEEYRTATEAFFGISLDGLTQYRVDLRQASRELEAAGWTLNGEGQRSKTVNGETVELRLTLGIPKSWEAEDALETYLVKNLEAIGVTVTLKQMSMEELGKEYRGETQTADLLYLGEDFSIRFDPEILAPTEETAGQEGLTAAKAEMYAMAQDMVKTDPNDIAGFMRKWVALQKKISETLPLLPVYSNVYFDFYSRELHDYRITQAASWGKAITESYMSDVEILGDEEKQSMQERVEELERQFETDFNVTD